MLPSALPCKRVRNAGSIIGVVATDAPLLPSQITRLCERAALGVGRVGSFAAHASGEIIIGFSTANRVPRNARPALFTRVEQHGQLEASRRDEVQLAVTVHIAQGQ